MAALDMVMEQDSSTPVCYLDTGLLFEQTLELVERAKARYGISPIPIRPALTLAEQGRAFGPQLWATDPDKCCALRKVEPMRKFLSQYDAWMTGLRRDQAGTRADLKVVERDTIFGGIKISPFAGWDERMVWAYVRAHDVPYNSLHDEGFPTLGCTPCTRRVEEGEHARAGRWAGFDKIECGLHARAPGNERVGL